MALLFWFFGDFRCGVPLFIAVLVIYKHINLFVLSFFPRDVLDEIRDLIESVSGGLPT